MLSNIAPFAPRSNPAELALLSRLDALAALGPERAQRWSSLFAAPEVLGALPAALELWLHLRRGLPRPAAPTLPLFQLLVARWAQAGRWALEEDERRYQFTELEVLTAARTELWSVAGVGPKKVVALGRSVGVELLLDLLAVLRLGGCACWVPPLGEPFERVALELAAPDFLVGVDLAAAKSVPEAKALDGGARPTATLRVRALAASYAPEDPCLLVFSPLQAGAEPSSLSPPTPLAAGQLLRALGLDAAFAWCLRDGDRMAAPGFCAQRYQPLLALTALLAGACFHFSSAASAGAAVASLRGTYRALGVSSEARDALLREPPNAGCQLWARELEEAEATLEWRRFTRIWRDRPESQALSFDPGLGAVALLAPSKPERRAGADDDAPIETPCFPALGERWSIAGLPGAAAGDPTGLLKLEAAGGAAPYLLVQGRTDGAVLYLGSHGARRVGRVFPGGITCAAVTYLPAVLGATTLAIPGSGEKLWRFGLLIFVAASGGRWDERRAQAVETALARHVRCVLAPELRPDFLRIYPVQPRRGTDGVVDAEWAAAERWSGGLDKRAQRELFRQMTYLSEAPSK